MRYFTEQLWIAFQGPRRDAALKTWSRRFKQYQKQLKKILPGLGPTARPFFQDALCLHDGTLTRMEVGDCIDEVQGRLRKDILNRRRLRVRLSVLGEVVKQRLVIGHSWYALEYKNVERIDFNYPGKLKLFPVGHDPNWGDWGYDELTSPSKKLFRHEILFASGATITIDFRDFSFRRTPARKREKS